MVTKRNTRALLGAALLAGIAACANPQPPQAPGANTRFLDEAGGRIAYDDTGGTGPLVLAIPGMGDLRSEYRLIRPALVAAGYRVVTMDLRGHGESSARWDDYSAHAIGNDALALLDQLQAGPAIILGNSFAAGAALWAAHDAPARVSGVVLLGPVVRDPQPAPSWLAKLGMQAALAGPWRTWVWTSYWDSLFPTRKPADQAQAKAALARNLHEPGRTDALAAMIALSKADTAAMLPGSRVPALVVMGTLDPDFGDPAAEAHWLADRIGAQTLIVAGAGHYPHVELPEQVLPALLPFIARVRAADCDRCGS